MKRYILKTQLNLDTAEQTLLIPLLGRGKQFELEPIEKLSNPNYSIVVSCLQSIINRNWVRNLLCQYPQDAVVKIGADLNIRLKRLDLLLAIQLRQYLGMYLSKQQLKQLFDKLIENFSDFVLPLMVKRQKRLLKLLADS